MNRTEALTEVLRDPTRSAKEREVAARALQVANVSTTDAALAVDTDPQVMADDTRMLLTALRVERIADLNEDTYQRYCVACVHPPEAIVREFRLWVAPDAATLSLIGMSPRDYWRSVYDLAAANRPDAQAHAWRHLAALP